MMRIVVVAAVLMSACESYVCTLSVEPSVVVEIYDRATGVPVAAGARGFIRDGQYQDSLKSYSGLGDGTITALAAGTERAGVYAVHVENPAYLPWDTVGVVVRSDRCHVRTARIVARLIPR